MKIIADFILIFGFAIITVIIFWLATFQTRKLAQNILIIFLSISLLIILTVLSAIHELNALFFALNIIEDGARFILGPLFFLYIKSIIAVKKIRVKGLLEAFFTVHHLSIYFYYSEEDN